MRHALIVFRFGADRNPLVSRARRGHDAGMPDARYVHGHHESVLRSHEWRTADPRLDRWLELYRSADGWWIIPHGQVLARP